jgi:hypothetical protein
MKKRMIVIMALIFLFCSVVFAAGQTDTAAVQTVNSNGFNEIISHDITLQWKISGNSMDIIVSAPGEGWVSVGFDATNIMQDANILIGYVDNGKAELRDDFGTSPVTHKLDTELGGTEDFSNLSGVEENGITELRFTIPLDSGDSYDKVLVPEQEYQVILAYSKDKDSYKFMHTDAATVKIKL